MRFDPLPLLIAQPKQVPAHDPNPFPKTNQDPIVSAQELMSSNPKHCHVYTACCRLACPALPVERLGADDDFGRHRQQCPSRSS
jgi:hypothetical protein